jgi:hypothetical protein
MSLTKNVSLLQQLKNWLTNTKPNNTDLAKRLEQEHKTLFLYLVDATNFYLNLVKKFPKASRSTAQTKILSDYLLTAIKVKDKWMAQQKELEKAGVPVFTPKFFDYTTQAALNDKAAKMRAGIAGADDAIGVAFLVPLIWFGVVSVAGWATTKIVDMLTTTTQEQMALMHATEQTAKNLGLSPDQSAALLQSNTAAVDNKILPSGGSMILYLGLGLAAYLFLNKK